MPKFKVYISDYDYLDLDIEKSVLEPIGAEVIGLKCVTGKELGTLAADADAILQQYAKINRDTIEQLKNCKVICRYGTGVDILDVQAAYDNGMLVTNVPDYALDEVADHSIAMGFMLLRRLPMYYRASRAGVWHWSAAGIPFNMIRRNNSDLNDRRDKRWNFRSLSGVNINPAYSSAISVHEATVAMPAPLIPISGNIQTPFIKA